MKLVDSKEFVTTMIKNEHHFAKLISIVKETGETLENNCVYDIKGSKKTASLFSKQRNLYSISKYGGNNIIEIGFNAGHSALIFLLANPDSVIWCFDICTHKYTELCFQYLNTVFGNRISLIKGNSFKVYTEFAKEQSIAFDTFNIDGSKEFNIANNDYFISRSIAHVRSVIIWDSSQIQLKYLWDGYIRDKDLIKFEPVHIPEHPHSIAFFIKTK